MDSELIIQVLNDACQDDNLNFQIILQESTLHIYINREANSELDYAQILHKISDALTTLNISWEGFWLYSRVIGELEPDWQTYIEFQVDLFDNESDPLIEETEDLITEAKESLQDLKYLKDKDILPVEELDDKVLDKDSFLLVMESAEEIDNSTGDNEKEALEDPFVVEELDDAILDKNSHLLALESAEEIDNSMGENQEEEDLEDPFVVEELDDAILDKNSHLLALESAEEVDNSIGENEEQEEDLEDPFIVEELDDAILNKNSFLLIRESAEEINNSPEEIEQEEVGDLFVVEELEQKNPEQESDISAKESDNAINNYSEDLEEEDLFVVEQLDDKILDKKSDSLARDSDKNIDNPENSSTETINFSEYCFISNQRLLTSDLVAPKLNIAHLISFFHNLSQENKKLLLPLLKQYLKPQKSIIETDKEQFSLTIQEWLQQIRELSSEQTRKAAIWFSRYCFNPEKTISEIQIVFDTEAAKQAAEKQGEETSASPERNQNSNNLGVSASTTNTKYSNNHQSSNYLPSNLSSNQQELEPGESRGKLSGSSINLLVPIIWIAVTLFFVIVGLVSNNLNSVNSAGIPVICENINNAESTDYCQLTVDLVGHQLLEEVSQEAIPFSSEEKYIALYYCNSYANVQAGLSLSESAPINTPVIYSYGEEILPGIYFAEATQHKFKEEGNNTVRVACTIVNQEKSPALLASDIIPNNWPAEAYKGKTSIRRLQSLDQSLGIYSIFAVMGFGTLFTAIGLFVASMFDWGITIYSMDALYKSAFIMGILEVIFAQIPIIGWINLIALKALTLGITSAFVKGFKVNWSEGYRVVFLGTITILGIRTILNFSMILLISAFIA